MNYYIQRCMLLTALILGPFIDTIGTAAVRDATQEINALDPQSFAQDMLVTPEVTAHLTLLMAHLTHLVDEQKTNDVSDDVAMLVANMITVIITNLEPETFSTLCARSSQILDLHKRCPQEKTTLSVQDASFASTDTVLALVATIVTHFANIVASPNKKQDVGRNLAGMFAGVLTIARDARRASCRTSTFYDVQTYLDQSQIGQQLKESLVREAIRLHPVQR